MAIARKRSKQQPRASEKLTEKAIEQHIDERSFQRGQQYFESGAVFDCRRQGNLLKARCRGQSAEPYAVSARVRGGKIKQADCLCPIGAGGHCKHVAALLLTWVRTPEVFHEAALLEERLSKCSKDELVELIQRMLECEPDLESWLELALPAAGPSGQVETVDSEPYRRQTVVALSHGGYGWEADREVAAALESLHRMGDQFRSRKNMKSASAVYRGILEGIIGEYESFHDENGTVCSAAAECITALGKCLPQIEGSTAKEAVLRTLFDVVRFDINFGGIGLSDEALPILTKRTTAAERATVAGWIHKALPASPGEQNQGGYLDRRRKTWGRLLLDLGEESQADDNAYVEHCRKFGLIGALVERLLERGRLDKALQEINASSSYELMGLADRLISHKHVDLAHDLVRGRLSTSEKRSNAWQLREWLLRFYQSRKKWKPLLELRVEGFRGQPSLEAYQEIRKLATKLETWKALRPDLLSSVPRDSTALIRIHLAEREVDQAIALWESRAGKVQKFAGGWDRVDLEVAQAAEKTHPETALGIYRAEVNFLINARGRENYQSACQLLKKIRPLLNAADWDRYISRLREDHRALRALHEELKKSRL